VKEYFETDTKILKLNIVVPYKEMLKEAQALNYRFTDHRGSETHKGWKSLALHGLDEHRHENWSDYGYKSAADAAKDFKWTDAANDCPVTTDFLQNKFPCHQYGRVRFMLLEAGGWIGMHNDSKSGIRLAENINIALNNPIGCMWNWGDGESFYMEPGNAYAMNISYDHAIVNNSSYDRYHLIVARHDSTPEWRTLIEETRAPGRFTTLDDLP